MLDATCCGLKILKRKNHFPILNHGKIGSGKETKLIMLNSGWLVGHSRKGIQGPACWQVPEGAEGSPAQLRAQQHPCSGSGLQDEDTSSVGVSGQLRSLVSVCELESG